MTGETVLVCGGRDYADRESVWAALDTIAPTAIIEGGARGADELARAWAQARGVPCTTVCADWHSHGRSAGPRRNAAMLKLYPTLVLAFPGGRGTADMVRRALRAGIEVVWGWQGALRWARRRAAS